MKLHASTNTVEKSGNFEENQFSIEASAKAFMILSDGLYSNKILAVIRELSTNAYDSHVDAGKGHLPFEVHLPTRLEPYFHVRDFGTSMTHEQCMTLYTTYFRSTRNDSNDAVGCLGLGSKAPFAYADSFTVEAFKDGEKRIYSAHRDANGNPTFSLMETVDTDQPNGVKVSMPVQNSDCDNFDKEATKVYQHFNIKPRTNKEMVYDTKEIILKDKNDKWEFVKRGRDNFVIMGQIAYPLDEDQFGSFSDKGSIAKFLWNTSGLILYADIGDVEITPSREALSYTEETKKNIINLVKCVISDIKNSVEKTIKSQPTLFLARKKYVEIESQCSSIKTAIESLGNVISYNGKQIFDEMVYNKINVKNMGITQIDKSGYRSKVQNSKDIDTIPFDKDSYLIIDDLPRGGMTRIRTMLKENHSNNYYSSSSNGYSAYVYKLRQDLISGTEQPHYYDETKENNSFLKVLGDATPSNVLFTSDMPKPASTSYGSNYTYSAEVRCFNWYGDTGKFESRKVSVKEANMVFIPATKKKSRYDSKTDCELGDALKVDAGQLTTIMNLLCKYYGVDVYGKTICLMTPSQIKQRKLEGRSNWEGPEFIMDYLKQLVKDSAEEISEIRHAHRCSHNHLHNIILDTTTDNKAKQIVLEYQEYHDRIMENQNDLDAIWKFGEKMGMSDLWEKPEDFDRDAKYLEPLNKEMKKYPLLDGINTYRIDDSEISAYIDMVENSTKELTNV